MTLLYHCRWISFRSRAVPAKSHHKKWHQGSFESKRYYSKGNIIFYNVFKCFGQENGDRYSVEEVNDCFILIRAPLLPSCLWARAHHKLFWGGEKEWVLMLFWQHGWAGIPVPDHSIGFPFPFPIFGNAILNSHSLSWNWITQVGNKMGNGAPMFRRHASRMVTFHYYSLLLSKPKFQKYLPSVGLIDTLR